MKLKQLDRVILDTGDIGHVIESGKISNRNYVIIQFEMHPLRLNNTEYTSKWGEYTDGTYFNMKFTLRSNGKYVISGGDSRSAHYIDSVFSDDTPPKADTPSNFVDQVIIQPGEVYFNGNAYYYINEILKNEMIRSSELTLSSYKSVIIHWENFINMEEIDYSEFEIVRGVVITRLNT